MTREEAQQEMITTWYDEARAYLDPRDRDTRIEDLEPPRKRSAFMFLAMTLHGVHPPVDDDGLYYEFGFCTCTKDSEGRLGAFYQEFLLGDKLTNFWTRYLGRVQRRRPACTFDEFWRAFDSGKLVELIDSKGFKSERESFKHLDTILNYPPEGRGPSVWTLQAFLNDKDKAEVPRSVFIDYGFVHCDSYMETMELKQIYEDLLRVADHLALHEACIKGRLWSFATKHIAVDSRFEKIMRNYYPLPKM